MSYTLRDSAHNQTSSHARIVPRFLERADAAPKLLTSARGTSRYLAVRHVYLVMSVIS